MEEREGDQGCGGRRNDVKLASMHRQKLTGAQRKAGSPEKGREQRFFKRAGDTV